MALINCPECNKEISDTVKTCPHCGFKIKRYLRDKNDEKNINNTNKDVEGLSVNNRIKKFIPLILAALIVLLVIVVIAIPKHEWIEADCTNPERCTICGKTRGEALGHDFLEATCTQAQVCTRCGETQGKPLGHNYGEFTVITEATCSEAGEKNATCSVCGDICTESISQLAHTAGEWIVIAEPTFAEDGERVQYCTVCGKEIKTEKISLPADEKETLFKAACETFSYADYARDPDSVKGEYCKTYGEVCQVFSHDDGVTFDLRINITKNGTSRVTVWTDDIWVIYTKPEGTPNVLEDDLITFYGVAGGTYSYETVSGGKRTVPLVYASYVDIGENDTNTQKISGQSTTSQETSSSSSEFAFSADVFCQEDQGLYVTFVGVDDPAGKLEENYIGVKFLITNNNGSKVTLLLRGFTINDCSFETSGGASEIAADAKSFLTCKVKKDKLADYGISSIDKISGYFWVSDIGYTDTFTINTK